jgi:hypothetical protein
VDMLYLVLSFFGGDLGVWVPFPRSVIVGSDIL